MKTIFKALFFLSFILIFTACGGSGHGSGSDTTADQNDYRLVSEVAHQMDTSNPSYFIQSEFEDHNTTYTYNSDNLIIQQSTINQYGHLRQTLTTYENGKTTTLYENNNSGSMTITGKVESSSTSLIYYSNLNTATEGFDDIMTTLYNESGKPTLTTFDGLWEFTLSSSPSSLLHGGSYYRSYGSIPTDNTENESDGIIDAQISYEYNTEGLLSKQLYDTDGDGSFDYNVSISYNGQYSPTYAEDTKGNYESMQITSLENGKPTAFIHDINGSVNTTRFTYTDNQIATNYVNDSGNETNTTVTYTSDEKILNKTVVSGSEEDYSHYTYDDNGNIIHFESTFERMDTYYTQPVNRLTSYARGIPCYSDFCAYDFEYDEYNNLIKQTYYDHANGIPTATVEYTWEKAE